MPDESFTLADIVSLFVCVPDVKIAIIREDERKKEKFIRHACQDTDDSKYFLHHPESRDTCDQFNQVHFSFISPSRSRHQSK